MSNSEFFDVDGKPIDYADSGCSVTVSALADYVEGINQELQDSYDELTITYNELVSDYESLESELNQVVSAKNS